MSIFFFATLVYSRCRTVWENISRITYQDETSESEVDSFGHFGRLLQARVSDLAPLFSPEERRQKRPVVFIDVRGAMR